MKYRGECEVALEKAVLGNLNTIAEVGPREKSRNHKTLQSAKLKQIRINAKNPNLNGRAADMKHQRSTHLIIESKSILS